MRTFKNHLVTLLSIAIVSLLVATTAFAQSHSTALERGYRTGYSDGYSAGYNDNTDQLARDYEGKEAYRRADRSYNQVWGPLEDYRSGYQQGFAKGYAAGYDGTPFSSSLPPNLSMGGTANSQDTPSSDESSVRNSPSDDSGTASTSAPAPASGSILIPRDQVFVVELLGNLSTDVSHDGDPFKMRVVQPGEYQGAIITGRVSRVKRAGKVKGTAELQLTFEQIRLPDNRPGIFNAQVIEVVSRGDGDGVGDVDSEGGVRGKSTTKGDITKVGAAGGIGAIIGAIAGGGKGAVIGAAIGGAAGTGGVMTQRGEDIRLQAGQQLRIRTVADTRIQ